MSSRSSEVGLVPSTNDDEEMSRSDVLKPDVYRHMKVYFTLTCQSIDENTSKAKRIRYHFLRFMIFCFASFYFVYTLGLFGSNRKPYNLGYSFLYYPITVVERAMWELRWLVTCVLGLCLTRQVWVETFEGKLKDIKLDENRWKKVNNRSWGLGFALLFMWIVNVLGNFITINFRISQLNLGLAILVDSLMSLLDRILAFPLFFLFCVTLYTLCCMVDQYRQDIETWGTSKEPESSESSGESGTKKTDKAVMTDREAMTEKATMTDQEGMPGKAIMTDKAPMTDKATMIDQAAKDENSARESFRKIKDAIRITGHKFELYLTIHFLFLVCTFFLGVCACFEQMEVKVAENNTMPLPFQIPRSTRFINFFGNISVATDYTVLVAGTSAGSARLLTPSHVHYENNTFNKTGIDGNDAIRTKWLIMIMRDILFCSLAKTLESLLLYLVPVSLMVLLNNRLRQVYEVIEDSNVEKHQLFNNVQVIRRMCKYVKTAHGLKIYGYTLPTFQAIMLAAFGTFFAVVIQRLLLHIHMK